MKKILKFLDDHFEKIAVSVCMGYFVTVTVLQVIFRFVLKMPAAWTEETARYSFIWMTFLGAPLAVKTRSHIRVDMLEQSFHGAPKAILYWICQAIFLAFTIIMTAVGSEIVMALQNNPQFSPALKLPMQCVYAALPVGMGLCSFRIIQSVYLALRFRGARTEGGR